MSNENKEKAMLADDLSQYIREKHNQDECIGFSDGYKSALKKLKLMDVPSNVSGSASDFEKDLGKLINDYVKAGLKKPDLVKKMEWMTGNCKFS